MKINNEILKIISNKTIFNANFDNNNKYSNENFEN